MVKSYKYILMPLAATGIILNPLAGRSRGGYG